MESEDVPARTSKGEQTRRAILDAAIARFGRDGFRSTSVADIARDAGVSGTLAYAYFKNKEGLFLEALDEDAAAVIYDGVLDVIRDVRTDAWRESAIFTMVDAVERHPLAARVLSGLEPDVTDRVIELSALTELRKTVAERLEADQMVGLVRSDIDTAAVGAGIVTIMLSLLMSVLQFGRGVIALLASDIWAVLTAAVDAVDGSPVDPPAGPDDV